MSSAEPRPGRRRRRQAGTTALEMMVALSIIAVLSLVVERVITMARRSDKQLGSIREVVQRGERIGYDLNELVSASRRLFQGDAVGQDYFDALELDLRLVPITTLRLPIADELGGLRADEPGSPHTGNALLFVREADAAPTVADAATGKLRYIDTYRFVCVYIAQTGRYVMEEAVRKPARDLVIWRSMAYPSYAQISTIGDPVERANVLKDLYERFGYEYCWDADAAVEDAFYELGVGGSLAGSPTPKFSIPFDLDLLERGRLVYANCQLARTDPTSHERRAILTTDDPADWVPDGFEVKIVGASGSRKVWMHVVVEAQAGKGMSAVHTSTVVASANDM